MAISVIVHFTDRPNFIDMLNKLGITYSTNYNGSFLISEEDVNLLRLSYTDCTIETEGSFGWFMGWYDF